MSLTVVRSTVIVSVHGYRTFSYNFACNDMHIVTCLDGRKWLLNVNVSHFPCGALEMIIILNKMTAAVNLPTINDIHCKIGIMIDYYSCTVYALQFQDTPQRGKLKHSDRVHISLACRHSVHGISCIHAAKVAARHCACCCPWLQSLAA